MAASSWDDLVAKVDANPADFSSYTRMVAIAEGERNVDKMRTASERFLGEFPLLYGYWKKFAEFTFETGGPTSPWREVYDRAVQAVGHSVDLWTYYVTAMMERAASDAKDVFERGIDMAGADFQAHTLWEKYIAYEANYSLPRAVAVYRRVIRIPMRMTHRFQAQFEELVNSRQTRDLLEPAEYEELTSSAQSQLGPDGDLEAARKRVFLEGERAAYAAVAAEVEKRKEFEDKIKPSFFNVEPLDEAQLENWRRYLEFEEGEGDRQRVIKLYERCIIPTANYTEFFVRYVHYLESQGLISEARAVLQRVMQVYQKRRPAAYLAFAAFEEQYGNIDHARYAYQRLTSDVVPGHVESIIKFANFERRQGSAASAAAVYESALQSATGKTRAAIALRYALFAERVERSVEKVRSTYESLLEQQPDLVDAWVAYIAFEASTAVATGSMSKAQALVDRAMSPDSPVSASEEVRRAVVEFENSVGTSITRLRDLEYSLRYGAARPSKLAGRKRGRDASTDGETASKVAKTDGAATAADAAAAASSTTSSASTSGSGSTTAAAGGYDYAQYVAYYQQYYGYTPQQAAAAASAAIAAAATTASAAAAPTTA